MGDFNAKVGDERVADVGPSGIGIVKSMGDEKGEGLGMGVIKPHKKFTSTEAVARKNSTIDKGSEVDQGRGPMTDGDES
ncbi:hypothetical protein PoB_004124300 [Plakobranchus ocellatus]|uniref:Uncharacterized protein n=1 Tax=Plakobranchus ocellatus TaxID=259542 RepID=A0AAV4B578_9GAST|nr:hypothetical protein PoB_004124300 [Plakobranchus ocellatus]